MTKKEACTLLEFSKKYREKQNLMFFKQRNLTMARKLGIISWDEFWDRWKGLEEEDERKRASS